MAGFYLELGAPKKPKQSGIKEEIMQKGYVVIASETLGMNVCWVRDESVKRKLPKQAIAFTLEELNDLKGVSKEELVDYTTKKIFNAKEVDVNLFLKP